jgi:hypothetical protein
LKAEEALLEMEEKLAARKRAAEAREAAAARAAKKKEKLDKTISPLTIEFTPKTTETPVSSLEEEKENQLPKKRFCCAGDYCMVGEDDPGNFDVVCSVCEQKCHKKCSIFLVRSETFSCDACHKLQLTGV